MRLQTLVAHQLSQSVMLKATEGKVEMSSTSPETGTATTHLAGSEDNAEKYLHDVSGDAEGFEGETPQAKQAKAEALAHARAARAARARYARLTSQQAGVPTQNPNNKMQAENFNDVMAQGDRIGGAEASLVATKVFDQVRTLMPEATTPLGKGTQALLSYAPLLWLRPEKRGSGVGAFVADPRVWSLPAVVGLAVVGDQVKGRITQILDRFTQLQTEKEQLKGEVMELVTNAVESKVAELRQNPSSTSSKGKSA
jgi:hypothetical protein